MPSIRDWRRFTIYRARRDALLDALTHTFPAWSITGAAAGLHLVAMLPDDEVAAVIERAARRSVRLYTMDEYGFHDSPNHAIIFGYAPLSEQAIADGMRRLI